MKLDPALALALNNYQLRLLRQDDADALAVAASNQRIWHAKPISLHEQATFKQQWFAKAIQAQTAGMRAVFVVMVGGEIIGSTSYYEMSEQHRRLTMGYTWYHPDYWGSAVNAVAKYLLLEYAFEQLGVLRVAFSVDSINAQSCRALEKLGIKVEGVLRNHIIREDGSERDSVIFSVIAKEWPVLKAQLQQVMSARQHNEFNAQKDVNYER